MDLPSSKNRTYVGKQHHNLITYIIRAIRSREIRGVTRSACSTKGKTRDAVCRYFDRGVDAIANARGSPRHNRGRECLSDLAIHVHIKRFEEMSVFEVVGSAL